MFQCTEFHDPAFTGASFVPTASVCTTVKCSVWLRLFILFLIPSRKILGYYCNQVTTISFHIHSNSLFIYQPTIRHNIVWDYMSLN
jgi:hypothetical protein